jgi:hypothetical protein
MDINGAQRITLFEFVKGMRGSLSPYRQAMIDYVFVYINVKNDGVIDEEEVLNFYQNSNLPDILNGTSSSAAKSITFFRAMAGSTKSTTKVVKVEQFNDFYLTQSLTFEYDKDFVRLDFEVELGLTLIAFMESISF